MKNKILIISGLPFRTDTNLGKTLRALFASFKGDEIAQLYFSPQLPLDEKCNEYFQINEKQLLRSAFGLFSNKCGQRIQSGTKKNAECIHKNSPQWTRKKTSTLIKIARDFLWDLSLWKNKKLKHWLDDIQPNLIFMVFPDTKKSAKIASWIAKRYSCPILLYVTDDYYRDTTLKKSLLRKLYYKSYHNAIRKMMSNVVKIIGCSELAAKEYGERFKINYTTIYTPAPRASFSLALKSRIGNPLVFRYFGNLGLNRWKTLNQLALILKEINKDEVKAVLEVYSAFDPSEEIKKGLNIENASSFRGAVFGEDYYQLLQNTDVAVHVESFDQDMMERTRLSISTKIADYLGAGKCILAIGDKGLASIQHLENKAVVVHDLNSLKEKVELLIEDQNMIINLERQARKNAEASHNSENISRDLKTLLGCL